MPTKGMLLQNWILGHMQCLWDLRCNQNIINIFKDIYSLPRSKDLLVSFDAVSVNLPPEAGIGEFEKDTW